MLGGLAVTMFVIYCRLNDVGCVEGEVKKRPDSAVVTPDVAVTVHLCIDAC